MDELKLQRAIEFIENKTKQIPHGNKSFYEHLLSTFKFLLKTGEEEYICLAGLYHSIYDTCYFNADIDITREQIIELIGDRAENLVYIFCQLPDRTPSLIFDTKFDKQTTIDLLKIEYANLIDQNFEPDDITLYVKMISKKLQWILQS